MDKLPTTTSNSYPANQMYTEQTPLGYKKDKMLIRQTYFLDLLSDVVIVLNSCIHAAGIE